MHSNCNGVSCFQQIFEKKLKIYLWSLGIFTFVSSSTFLTAFWPLIFVSAEPSRAILSIDRSEPRFESHTGGEIMKTLKILTVFVNFRLSQIQNYSVQIKKMKDSYLENWRKNYFCQTFTNDARLKNVPRPLDLTRILKSYHKRNDRRKFPEK